MGNLDTELEKYIEDHIEAEPEHLRRLEKETNLRRINGRMCSGHIQGRILKMLTRLIAPENVLELGTFTGYSALCIAEGLPKNGKLTTIELEDELEEPILEAFSRSEAGDKITLLTGDAREICAKLPAESFDMVFVDADKRQYPQYYTEVKRLLKPGGVMIADNTLWDGHVTEEGRDDPQTAGVKEFNRLAAEDADMEVAILPVRDGLSIIRKRNRDSDC